MMVAVLQAVRRGPRRRRGGRVRDDPMTLGVLAHGMPGTTLRWWYPEVWAVVLAFCTIYFYLVGPFRERHGLAPRMELPERSEERRVGKEGRSCRPPIYEEEEIAVKETTE